MKVWEMMSGTAIDIANALSGGDLRLAPKYFVLSLHRSGTRSVTLLFEQHGLRAVHWPVRNNGFRLQPKIVGRETDRVHVVDVIEPVINKNDAMTDVPIPVLYRELNQRYPNAKFLLLRRRASDWIASVRRHVGVRPFHPYERVQYWHYFPARPASLAELSDANLAGMCERHVSEVTDFFSNRGDKFALFDLEDEKAGPGVAAFLGSPTGCCLPHVTDTPKIG